MTKPVALTELLGNNQSTRISDPLPKHLWRIREMPTFDGLKLPPLQIETVSLPMPTLGVGEAQVAATSIYFPEASQVDAFNIVVHESYRADALKYFVAWQNNIQNPYTGGFYLPSRYKKTIVVDLFNYLEEHVMSATLHRVWPNTMNEWELGAEAEPHKLSVSLSIDAMIPEFKL